MRVVPVERLATEIQTILDDYADDLGADIEEATQAVAKSAVKAVRANSRSSFGGTGKYASGWTYKVEKNGSATKATVYNQKAPGLPHLLEFGHAKRNGGRVAGRAHIAPVEETVVETFQKKVEDAIT